MLVKCHLCSSLTRLPRFDAHWKYVHKHNGLVEYKCAVASCGRFFSNKRSFRKHAASHPDYPTNHTNAQFHTQSMSTSIDSPNNIPCVEITTFDSHIDSCFPRSHTEPPLGTIQIVKENFVHLFEIMRIELYCNPIRNFYRTAPSSLYQIVRKNPKAETPSHDPLWTNYARNRSTMTCLGNEIRSEA